MKKVIYALILSTLTFDVCFAFDMTANVNIVSVAPNATDKNKTDIMYNFKGTVLKSTQNDKSCNYKAGLATYDIENNVVVVHQNSTCK